MHTLTVEPAMLVAGLVIVVAILATRVSLRFGVPSLLLFLTTGMLAGSDGLGGIWFDDAATAWALGVVALAVLLFSAGAHTPAHEIRPVLAPGLVLASVGVGISASLVALFWAWAFDRPVAEGALLGAIISSTDAAAVFGVLGASGLRLRGRIQPLLEMESGTNDPVAIFLTLAATAVMAGLAPSVAGVGLGMGLQMGLGVVAGVAGGASLRWVLNRLRVPQAGLYPVFAVAGALLLFGGTAMLGGSGFLAVYLGGMMLGAGPLVHRKGIGTFLDALAWLAQIGMFVVLGLLAFPSRLPGVALEGVSVAAFLVLVARPLSVVVSLTPFGFTWREQAMIAWVGLRGAVPIVLATWPMVVGAPGADRVFDVVFFVVLVSVLVQGTSLGIVARLLKVGEDREPERASELAQAVRVRVGRSGPLMALGLPRGALVAVLERDGGSVVPEGSTEVRAGDVAVVLLGTADEAEVRRLLGEPAG